MARALRSIPKNMEQRIDEIEIRERNDNIHITAQLKSAKIFRSPENLKKLGNSNEKLVWKTRQKQINNDAQMNSEYRLYVDKYEMINHIINWCRTHSQK